MAIPEPMPDRRTMGGAEGEDGAADGGSERFLTRRERRLAEEAAGAGRAPGLPRAVPSVASPVVQRYPAAPQPAGPTPRFARPGSVPDAGPPASDAPAPVPQAASPLRQAAGRAVPPPAPPAVGRAFPFPAGRPGADAAPPPAPGSSPQAPDQGPFSRLVPAGRQGGQGGRAADASPRSESFATVLARPGPVPSTPGPAGMPDAEHTSSARNGAAVPVPAVPRPSRPPAGVRSRDADPGDTSVAATSLDAPALGAASLGVGAGDGEPLDGRTPSRASADGGAPGDEASTTVRAVFPAARDQRDGAARPVPAPAVTDAAGRRAARALDGGAGEGAPPPADGTSGGAGGGDGGATADGKPAPSFGRRLLRDAREVLGTVAVALGIAIVIKTFLVQPFKIPSQSMEETLLVGDRVLVSKLEPGPLSLQRGDVVVFLDPGGWLQTEPVDQSLLNQSLTFIGLLPANSGAHLIKRVIGLPGDTVACCDVEGRLLVNNQPLDETVYLYPGDEPSAEEFTVTVPEGRIWVMGDHRSVSRDSRFHAEGGDLGAGAVPLENVVGRAVLVSWPLSRWDWLGRPEGVFDGVGGLDGVR